MRIITGKYKGRRISSIDGPQIRPATDRVKGSIFNMLQNRLSLSGARVLDLFAGSGSLGLEALSRGALLAVFVDDSPAALEAIESNAGLLGCSDDCTLVQSDAEAFIARSGETFQLIFADPPYQYERMGEIPQMIFGHKLLASGGFLIIEHAKQTRFQTSSEFRLSERREFGNTHISFFTYPSQSQAPIP